jgi:V8-like Glu-specific endopeptidase
MASRFTALALTCLAGQSSLGLASCHQEHGSPVAVRAQPILNGELDDGDPAVVGLMTHGTVYCTGTLIDRRVVVTAAHCVTETKPDQVFFGARTDRGGPAIDVEARRVHPDYAIATPEHPVRNDVAAILLADDPPARTPPVALLTTDLARELVAGAEIRIVGFGGVAAALGPVAIKRTGITTLDTVEAETLQFDANPAQTCTGDSGGPAFLKIAGREYLAGITSGGDPACSEIAISARVDPYIDSFFESFPRPTRQLGERCHYDGNCVSGLCAEPEVNDGFNYCSTPCLDDVECGTDLRCSRDASGARLCRTVRPGPGALGAACSADADCFGGLCSPRPGSSQPICSLACRETDAIACPTGYACIMADGDGGESGAACFFVSSAGETDASVLVLDRTDAGCSVVRPGGTGAAMNGWLFGALLTACNWLRRRASRSRATPA